jgi:flavin-dependent dehydrogenase
MTQQQETNSMESVDVLVIGAGPSGSLASALLNKAGIRVLVLEKQKFPRFSIGESLLPQSMVFLEKAGMLDAIKAGNYQLKNGAAFQRGSSYTAFDFEQKFSMGPGTTHQVKRADFDKRLADEAERQGVPIRYETEVLSFEEHDDHAVVSVRDKEGQRYKVKASFVLDASGFGRVLPRLLNLEVPTEFPARKALFCHFKDNITDPHYDRTKILVSVNPIDPGVWYWLIPFSDGTSSFGVVGESRFFDTIPGDFKAKLLACREMEPGLAALLGNAEFTTEVRDLTGYAAKVKSLYGKHFALLGNAGEFLDPVFSSGVTIAFKSADLATSLLIRMRDGETVDWQREYAEPLMKGVDTFRAFVGTWYDGALQDIIFHLNSSDDIREKLCAILAGYAWDDTNPYTDKTERRLRVLAEICKNAA